jgi:hypothetical protein
LADLRKQLQDVNGQIAALKASAAAGGETGAVASAAPDAAIGATTQPAVTGDSELLKQLQDQAESLNTKINARLTAIQADQAISPEQRSVNRDKAVEDQSILVKSLQDKERAATETATAAVAKANDMRSRLEKSRDATTKIDDLMKQVAGADADIKAAADRQKEKDLAVSACISLDGNGEPQVVSLPRPDQRPLVASIASGVIVVIFCFLIFSAHRAAHVPAAAPVPVQPLAPSQNQDARAEGDSDAPNSRQKNSTEQDEEPLPV